MRLKYLCGFYDSRVELTIANICEAEIFVWLRLRGILQIFVGRNCFVEFVRCGEQREIFGQGELKRESCSAVMDLPPKNQIQPPRISFASSVCLVFTWLPQEGPSL